jgi:hypothetical protein
MVPKASRHQSRRPKVDAIERLVFKNKKVRVEGGRLQGADLDRGSVTDLEAAPHVLPLGEVQPLGSPAEG